MFWNRTVLDIETVLTLNLIVWIEQFICVKMDLAWNNQQWLICHKTTPMPMQVSNKCFICLGFFSLKLSYNALKLGLDLLTT